MDPLHDALSARQAVFRLHGRLAPLLPRGQARQRGQARERGQALTPVFSGRQSALHLIESLGVPHTEVGQISVNGLPAEGGRLIRPGDQVDVYPSPAPAPGGPLARFVLDGHLGRLAAYLRMLGFDTLYWPDTDDARLAEISAEEERVLLTRDRGLLKRNQVTQGLLIVWEDPREQLIQVTGRFGKIGQSAPFLRCVRCNGLLEPVEKHAVAARLQPDTLTRHTQFQRCGGCGQVYWQGSHWERMRRFFDEVLGIKT